MKWKVLRLFLPFILLGFVLPTIIPGPDGRPIMSLSDWLPSQSSLDKAGDALDASVHGLNRAVNWSAEQLGQEPPDISGGLKDMKEAVVPSKKMYKWQDEFGKWHFTDDPKMARHKAGQEADIQQQVLNKPVNAIPAVKPSAKKNTSSSSFEPSLKNVPNVLGEAQRVKGQLEQRYRDTEQL